MHMRDTLVIEHNKSLEYTKANFFFLVTKHIFARSYGLCGFYSSILHSAWGDWLGGLSLGHA
jgi:hypothetical protein